MMRALTRWLGSAVMAALPLFSTAAWSAPMGPDEARLLLSRAGFSATETEVRQFSAYSREAAVERMLRASASAAQAKTAPPEWVNETVERPARLKTMSEEERREYPQREARRQFELKTWWMTEMLQTPSPLAEPMTLF